MQSQTSADFRIYDQKSISNKRQLICDEALDWIGTPFLHQQCVKHSGVDCAMLIVGVALNTGLITKDDLVKIPVYPQEWHMHNDVPILLDVMESFGCKEKSLGKVSWGDIVTFKIGRVPSHLGIVVKQLDIPHFVHAYSGTLNKVTVTPLEQPWIERLVGCYKFPGV